MQPLTLQGVGVTDTSKIKDIMRTLLSSRCGGDCIYMLHLEQLLQEHGHEVALFAMTVRMR